MIFRFIVFFLDGVDDLSYNKNWSKIMSMYSMCTVQCTKIRLVQNERTLGMPVKPKEFTTEFVSK